MQHSWFFPHFVWAEFKDLRIVSVHKRPISLKHCSQICLNLCHSKMCSFTVLMVQGGCPKTSQYQTWPPFASSSATHLHLITFHNPVIFISEGDPADLTRKKTQHQHLVDCQEIDFIILPYSILKDPYCYGKHCDTIPYRFSPLFISIYLF